MGNIKPDNDMNTLPIRAGKTGDWVQCAGTSHAQGHRTGASSRTQPKDSQGPVRVLYCADMPLGAGWYCCNWYTGEWRRYINKGRGGAHKKA